MLQSETNVVLGRLLMQLRKRHDLTTVFNSVLMLARPSGISPPHVSFQTLRADAEAGGEYNSSELSESAHASGVYTVKDFTGAQTCLRARTPPIL